MKRAGGSAKPEDLRKEIATLTRQLGEANETLRAIRKGEVDAVVVQSTDGNQVYTLQTADHPYRILVQQMNEGALMLSREGFILHANPRFSGLVMALPDDLSAQSLQSWIAPDDRAAFEDAMRQVFQGHPHRVELNLIAHQSQSGLVPVMISLSPLNLHSVDAVCAVVTDLRDRRQREAVERAALLTRSLMDRANAAVVITGRDGRILHANAAAEALAGCPIALEPFESAFPLSLEDGHLISQFDPESQTGPQQWVENLTRMAVAGSSFRDIQARILGPGGRIVELLVSAGPFGPAENEITGAVFTLSDVTALRNSEQRFRTMAETIPQIVWTLDRTGRMEYCNNVGLEYFGMTVQELAESQWEVVQTEDAARVRPLWLKALESAEPFEAEYRMCGHDGTAHWFLVRALPIRDANGRVMQWFGTSTDVDAQKRTETDLRKANADLEHFAYAASHDFQEPLRMVTAYTQLFQKEFGRDLHEPAGAYLRYVLEGTDRLGALLQNLLAYMRASRDPKEAAVAINCNEVLNEVIANLRLPIQQSGAIIKAGTLPNVVYPRVHMFELLQNLLTNAIKYRGDHPLQIFVSAKEEKGEWVISVRDNGIGIAPQHQENIFGVFKRLHGNNIPGTGIGLAICRRLVEQHQGRIWVESKLNSGSVFSFSLPSAVSERVNEAARA